MLWMREEESAWVIHEGLKNYPVQLRFVTWHSFARPESWPFQAADQ
jgi:hypothetical protein